MFVCLGLDLNSAITGNPEHMQMAEYFYKALFMDPLAHAQDSLNHNHANTHLPEIIGIARFVCIPS